MGFIMTKVNDEVWNAILPTLKSAVRMGKLNSSFVEDYTNKPTHILDIYKMRQGRYKNVRIWINLDLGTGRRKDLFITSADNQPLELSFDVFSSASEVAINWKEDKND